MKKYCLTIDGSRLSTDDWFDVINPATEEVVGRSPAATAEHLQMAVIAARNSFSRWSCLPDKTRRDAILAIAASLEESADELAELITMEQGKPLSALGGKGSRFEVAAAVKWCRVTAGLNLNEKLLVEDDAIEVKTCRKPLGVIGSITPWNWPLLIAIWHVIPALQTGNTVVLKPSPYTPLSTLKFVQFANQHLPPGVLNVIAGEDSLGQAMTSHPGIDKIVFTGSTKTGQSIMKNAATNLKRLTLELGGNDAAVILPDVNIEQVAPQILGAAFNNSGQTCGALKRLYVHDDIYDDLCHTLATIVADVTVGNGLDDRIDLGPVQNDAQLTIVEELAQSAKADGGRFLTGGVERDKTRKGFFFPITLVADIEDGSRLVDEEPFGPILPIIRYSDIDEVIARANRNPNGLGGSVWSTDVKLASELSQRLDCGTAWVNSHGNIRPDVPFGGVKQSGFGVEFGIEGLEEYTSIQVVSVNKA
jgi:acyl-CoA reductase-like NAD-dependent aldehyde dehydrogenase